MATSGSFNTTGYSDTNAPDYYVFSWSLSSQNTDGNYSVIKWSLYGAGGKNEYWYTNVKEKYVTVNGATQSNDTLQATYNGTTPFSGTTTIYHNTDGTKSFSASAGGAFYYYGSYNSTGSGTWTLPTIPRASSITSAGNVTLGNACNIKWTPASSSFKYKLKFSLGTWSATTGFISPATTSAYTYTGYTIPADETLYKLIPNSPTGTMSVALTTYNSSGAQIGSTSTAKTFTVTVPTSVKPSISANNITLTPQTYSYLIQNKNKLRVSVSGCNAGSGSSIRSYTFSGPGISSTTTSTSVTTSTISNTGTLTYKVTVTDSRGRTNYAQKTISCYAYTTPSLKLSAIRSNSSGIADDSGAYIKCSYTPSFSSVNSTNNVTVKIFYKKSSASTYSSVTVLSSSNSTSTGSELLSSIEVASTYQVYATITDNYNGSSKTNIISVYGAERIMNISSDGTGVAFGKMSEASNTLESKNPVWSYDDFVTKSVNHGYFVTNSSGNIETAIYKNGSNLWIGATQQSATHITGHTIISAGDSTEGIYTSKLVDGTRRSYVVLDTNNYTNYVSQKPTTLVTISDGSNGTITLSSSAANFTYLEIFYADNSTRQPHSIRVYSPNGKYITLSCVEPSTTGKEPRVYIKTSGWSISGTTMTPGRSDLSNANSGVYGKFYKDAGGTGVDVNVTENNYIKIFRVLGYA